MDTIIIAYWTQTGNTKAMAEAVGEGVETAGKKADVRHISEVSMDRLREAQAFALGCPAMGAEVLEEGEMEPFVMEVEGFAQGRKDRPVRFLWLGRRPVDAGLGGQDEGGWSRPCGKRGRHRQRSAGRGRPGAVQGPGTGAGLSLESAVFRDSLCFRKRYQ